MEHMRTARDGGVVDVITIARRDRGNALEGRTARVLRHAARAACCVAGLICSTSARKATTTAAGLSPWGVATFMSSCLF